MFHVDGLFPQSRTSTHNKTLGLIVTGCRAQCPHMFESISLVVSPIQLPLILAQRLKTRGDKVHVERKQWKFQLLSQSSVDKAIKIRDDFNVKTFMSTSEITID